MRASNLPRISFQIHPATALLLWLFFVIWLEFAAPFSLLVAGLILLPWLQIATRIQFRRYVRRSRWLLLSLLLVYAYATPGNLAWPALGSFSPAWQGLQYGLLRSARMLLMLAALAILMTYIHRQHLLVGLYCLLSPLKQLGIQVERLAVRLWLTLDYAETALAATHPVSFTKRMAALREGVPIPTAAPGWIELPVMRASRSDYGLLILVACAGVLSLW
jgi:energy-coupling factor transport system permease protein